MFITRTICPRMKKISQKIQIWKTKKKVMLSSLTVMVIKEEEDIMVSSIKEISVQERDE